MGRKKNGLAIAKDCDQSIEYKKSYLEKKSLWRVIFDEILS